MANSSRDKNKLLCEVLEPRLLFSAGLESLLVDDSLFANDTAIIETETVSESELIQLNETTDSASVTKEVVFIDESVDNYEQLIQDLVNRDNTDVFILDNSENGTEQISKVLANYEGLDAVHLVSHGNDQGLLLGNGSLDTWNLPVYKDAIEGWQTALSDSADLMIYGCNLAGSEAGVQLLNQLQSMTGADIAASDDTTGLTALGGDWELEYQTGDIEATLAFSINIQSNWQGTLIMGTNPAIANLNGDGLTAGSAYTEGDGAVILDQGTAAAETSGEGFNGGNLTVSFTAGNVAAEDILAINDQGAGVGNISLSGSDVTYDFGAGATTIGTYSGGSLGTDLVINFNGAATTASISALLQNISYENNDTDSPDTTQRTISFVLHDSDGDSSTPSDVTVDITAVNDAPALTAGGTLTAVNEDSSAPAGDTVSNLIGANFSDVDGDNFAGIAIAADASGTNGSWQYSTDSGTNWYDIGSVSTSSALLLDSTSMLRFVPAADYNGTAGALTVHAVDDSSATTWTNGATPQNFDTTTDDSTSRVSAAGDQINTSITAVNDNPTTTSNTVTTDEDTTYTFSAADFNFADVDGDSMGSVRITSLETAGSLQLNGVDVALNDSISKADIDAGKLTFAPATDANGTGYSSFDFSVSDGLSSSIGLNTMTIDVNPVSDNPVSGSGASESNIDSSYEIPDITAVNYVSTSSDNSETSQVDKTSQTDRVDAESSTGIPPVNNKALNDADIVLSAEADGTPKILIQHNIDSLLPQVKNDSVEQHIVVNYDIPATQSDSIQEALPKENTLLQEKTTETSNLDLDRLLTELNSELGDDTHAERVADVIIVTTAAVSIGLTSSFVAWSVKSGSIVAAISSAIPTWSGLDPLSIINKSIT